MNDKRIVSDVLTAADGEVTLRQYECFDIEESEGAFSPATLCVTNKRLVFYSKGKGAVANTIVHEIHIDSVTGYRLTDCRTVERGSRTKGNIIAFFLLALLAVALIFAAKLEFVKDFLPANFDIDLTIILVCGGLFLGIVFLSLFTKKNYSIFFQIMTKEPLTSFITISTAGQNGDNLSNIIYKQSPASQKMLKEFGALLLDIQSKKEPLIKKWATDFSVFDNVIEQITSNDK